MKEVETRNYLKSLIYKSANKDDLVKIIDSLSISELNYAFSYVYSVEKASGKDSVHIMEIKNENILFIRLECFLQVKF